jgi:hypothetical protein
MARGAILWQSYSSLVKSTHHLGAEGLSVARILLLFAAQYILMLVWPLYLYAYEYGMRGYCLSQLWKRSSAMLDCVGQKLRWALLNTMTHLLKRIAPGKEAF